MNPLGRETGEAGRLKTWHAEGAFVAIVLAAVAILTHGGWREWLGAVAVQLTFHHAAISERMAERQRARVTPDVDCWRWSTRLFVSKELLWFVYFAAVGAWSALVGVILFLAYPVWRRYWRSIHKAKSALAALESV